MKSIRLAVLAAAVLTAAPTIYAQAAPAATAATRAAPAPDVKLLLDRGVAFLLKRQTPEGSFQGKYDPPAITALALRALAGQGGVDKAVLDKGYAKLLSFQLENGGIYKDLLASYNTAIAISALAAAENTEYRPRIEKALDYLKSLQWRQGINGLPGGEQVASDANANYGGWGYGKKGRADGSNTQLVLDALHDAGVEKSDPAYQAALKFVSRMQNQSETNDQPWSGDDGGFIYTPANNGETNAGEYQGADGKRMLRSYGSMTYAGLKSMIYAGLSKDDPRVKAAWRWISHNWTLDENPGIAAGNPADAKNGLYYYYYTMARALRAYGEPVIVDQNGVAHDWRLELIEAMSRLQNADGSWNGEKRWMEDHPTLVTSYILLALQEARNDLLQHPAK